MKRKVLLLNAIALSVSMNLPFTLQAMTMPLHKAEEESKPSLAPMLERVLPAIVSVYVEGVENESESDDFSDSLRRFWGQSERNEQLQPFEGLASGVIIDAKNGYVLTNSHVISNADKVSVKLSDGHEYDSKVVGHDEQNGIALLQIINANHLTQISIADSSKLKVGDFAVAIGNPFGLGETATSGIISALGRGGLNVEGLESFIQTDAAMNRGNSGGALVNLKGELVGITTAILASAGGNIGIGFAIPGDTAMNLAQQIITFGEVKHAQLGIRGTEMTADMAKAFNIEKSRGAFVSEVLPNSAAAKAGIKAGDIITSVNGKSVSSFNDLRGKIGTLLADTTVKVGLLRTGKPQLLTVKLDNSVQSSNTPERLFPALRGATLSDSVVNGGSDGIKIDSIEKNSPAGRAGLQQGDIIVSANRARVRQLNDLRNILMSKPAVLALNIIRGKENIYLLLQ